MSACRLLILTAVLPEARAVSRALGLPEKWSRAGFSGVSEKGVGVGLIGVGGRRLGEVVRGIEPQSVIMAGLGGGLVPELKVGDVVMEGNVAAVPALVGVRLGRVHTSGRLVSTPEDKAALFGATGALVVDMETAAAQAFAAERGVPFAVLRAISDACDDFLDPRYFSLVDEAGKPRLGRVAALLCRHPMTLGGLLRMKRATEFALSHLEAALVSLVASGWPYERRIHIPPVSPSLETRV